MRGREQEEREARQRELRDLGLPPNADDMDPGALSDADPHTTNLYVGNLAPGIDEELLKKVRSAAGDHPACLTGLCALASRSCQPPQRSRNECRRCGAMKSSWACF